MEDLNTTDITQMQTEQERLPATPLQHTDPLRFMLKPNKPPKYAGQHDYNILESWIAAVNSYFFLSHACPPYIYHYLVTLVEGEAAIWFRYHYPISVADTLTWEEVRNSARAYFTPPNKDRRLQDEWAALRQTSTVSAYISRFSSLAMQISAIGSEIPDSMLLDKFIRGLKPKTRTELELKDPRTLHEAWRLADRYDHIIYRPRNETSRTNWNTSTNNHVYLDDNRGEPMQIDILRTSKGKEIKGKLQKLSPEDRTHLRKMGACFKCRQPGHMAKECPTNANHDIQSKNNESQ